MDTSENEVIDRVEVSSYGGMVHLNGNLLCAIDVETTGTDCDYHELVQLAILPLDSQIRPIKSIMPFYVNITPEYPERISNEALRITRKNLVTLIENSLDKYKAMDLFDEWYERLNLPSTNHTPKKIMPLWSNGSFDKGFIRAWLGKELYNRYFHFHERDTQETALFLNDRFCHHAEKVPFPKVGLNYIASCFELVNENAHDALADCIMTAEVYRRMLWMWTPVAPQAPVAEGPEVFYGRRK